MKALPVTVVVCLLLAVANGPASLKARETDNTKVIWRDPGAIAARDLTWGMGSAARAPKAPFTFVSEDTSGSKPKILVKDAAGASWRIKLATMDATRNEVHAEVAAGRLVWALGYFSDEHYFVPEGRIEGARDLKRAAAVVGPDGSFRTACFERRDPEFEVQAEWDLAKNDFAGTRELSGLQIMMLLIANWDTSARNGAIVRVRLPNGTVEDRHMLTDLGSSFGQARSSRWNLEHYAAVKFVTGIVRAKEVQFPIALASGPAPMTVPLDHVRWFANLAAQLTQPQVRQAFEAAGATPSEVDGFSSQVLRRIADLRAAVEK
jgi:hypothetical protein